MFNTHESCKIIINTLINRTFPIDLATYSPCEWNKFPFTSLIAGARVLVLQVPTLQMHIQSHCNAQICTITTNDS